MAEERNKSEIRVESEGTLVAEHSFMTKEKKKKKKSRENKDSFAGEDGEIAAGKIEKLGDDVLVKKKSKKQRVDSQAEKKIKEKSVDSEAEDDVKKSKEKRVDSEAEDGVKKSKEKSKEIRADSETEDVGKKSKEKSKEIRADSEAEDVGKKKKKKKSKKECGGDEIGNSEANQRDEKALVNTDDAKRKLGKRKRDDDTDLGAQENTDKVMKTKSKKKKPIVDYSEVEENNKDSMKDAKTKQSENSEAEGNHLNSTKDAKMKGKKKQSEASEANDSTKDEKKKRKKKQKCSKSDEDVTTPSSKSNKKVKFSDQVEFFPTEDKESEEEDDEEEEVEMVRGKRFTKEEDVLVKKAVLDYIDNHALGDEGLKMVLDCKSHPQVKGCWKEIESALPWRPRYSVYHRAHNLFEAGSKGIWTKEDLELVKQFQAKHGNDWKTLAEAMGKHRIHVKDAWRRIRLNMNKGHWSREEYQTLFDLVNTDLKMKAFKEKHSKHGMLRDNIPWMAISDQLGTRDHTLCCVKWYDQLTSPMVAKGIWANVDDYRLMDELTKLDAACIDDVDWDNLLENRDGEACRKRWNQMVLHIGSPGSKTFAEQVEILSQRYCPDLAEDREDFDSRPFDPED